MCTKSSRKAARNLWVERKPKEIRKLLKGTEVKGGGSYERKCKRERERERESEREKVHERERERLRGRRDR